eukprot:1050119-Alexandrium_andersonii.AAC.1
MDPLPWFTVMVEHPGAWRSWVSAALPSVAREAVVAHTKRIRQASGRGDLVIPDDAPPEPVHFFCYECSR